MACAPHCAGLGSGPPVSASATASGNGVSLAWAASGAPFSENRTCPLSNKPFIAVQEARSPATIFRVAAVTPLHTETTRPLALLNTKAIVCELSSLSTLWPLPKSVADTGTDTARPSTPLTACMRGEIANTADRPGGLAAITESSATRCAAPVRSVQWTLTLAVL